MTIESLEPGLTEGLMAKMEGSAALGLSCGSLRRFWTKRPVEVELLAGSDGLPRPIAEPDASGRVDSAEVDGAGLAPKAKPPELEAPVAGSVGLKPPAALVLGAGVAEGSVKAPTFGGAAIGAGAGAGVGADDEAGAAFGAESRVDVGLFCFMEAADGALIPAFSRNSVMCFS